MACKCEMCGKSKADGEFMPSSSPFWTKGHINICYDCVNAVVDKNDLNQVDRFLQFANMAFMPQEWRKIHKREKENAFRKYGNTYYEFNYYKYDWGEQNEKLMAAAKQGIVEMELEELKPSLIARLERTWGKMELDDLIAHEKYYNAILNEYDVTTEGQKDQFRKIARLSISIDKDLAKGVIDKNKMDQFTKMWASIMKEVDKTQSNAITSVGQIVEFIERNGYKANFYDGVSRDEIDMIIQNMKEYIQDLIRSETNLPEIYAMAKKRHSEKMQINTAEDPDEIPLPVAKPIEEDDDEIDVDDFPEGSW